MDLSTFLYICRKCGKQKKPTEEFCEACRALPQKQVHTPAFIKPEQPKPPIKQITPQPQAAFDGKSPQLIDTGLEKKKSGANMEASENQKWVYLCPNCKKQVRASAKFCGNCGKLFSLTACRIAAKLLPIPNQSRGFVALADILLPVTFRPTK